MKYSGIHYGDVIRTMVPSSRSKTKVYRFNPEAGGDAFFAIEMPEQTSYTLTEYKKVDKPNHIEYLDFFATSQGEKDTSLPGMQILIDFTSESAQRTLVTSTSIFPTKMRRNKHLIWV